MYNIVVIEDHHETGALLRTFIDNELERLVTAPITLDTLNEPPRNPKTGDRFEDVCQEPGQGQLVHLRHLIDHLELMRLDPESEIPDIFPTTRLFPLDALGELCQVAAKFQPKYGHRVEEDSAECLNLRAVVDRFCPPDILIVDLAMCDSDIARMAQSGGRATVSEDAPAVLPDPRGDLRTLTGFKLLRAYSRSVPVIVTSYLSNPLVAQHCLVNGAFAFVGKPVPGVADTGHDFRHAADVGSTALDRAAKMNKRPLDVVVTHYLTDAASEVLKAMNARWISTLR